MEKYTGKLLLDKLLDDGNIYISNSYNNNKLKGNPRNSSILDLFINKKKYEV